MPPRCGRRALGFRVPSSTEGFFTAQQKQLHTEMYLNTEKSQHPSCRQQDTRGPRSAAVTCIKSQRVFCSSTDRVENHKCTFILIALYTACDCRDPKPIREHGTCFQTAFSTWAAPQTVCEVHECRKKKNKQHARQNERHNLAPRDTKDEPHKSARGVWRRRMYTYVYIFICII